MGLVAALGILALPFVEIAVFIAIGSRIGIAATIALIIASALAGSALMRHQGLAVLRRVQENLDQGVFPAVEVFDGLCILLAGGLLLLPGFVTDVLGLLLFLPPVRRGLRYLIGRHLLARGRVTIIEGVAEPVPPGARPGPGGQPPLIEGRFEDITPGGDDSPRRRL